jgi:hypothetical protein
MRPYGWRESGWKEAQSPERDAWPGTKAGLCDESALQDLAASWSAPPQNYCAVSSSRRRVACSLGKTAPPEAWYLCQTSIIIEKLINLSDKKKFWI